MSLRISGTPEDSFNDGSIPCSQRLSLQWFLVHFWVTLSFVTSSVFPYVPPKRLHRPHEYKLNQTVYIVSGTFSSFVFITRTKHVLNLSRSMIFHFQVVANRPCQRKYILVPFTLHLKENEHTLPNANTLQDNPFWHSSCLTKLSPVSGLSLASVNMVMNMPSDTKHCGCCTLICVDTTVEC